jgi:CHASE2 domain-containing sensor protein
METQLKKIEYEKPQPTHRVIVQGFDQPSIRVTVVDFDMPFTSMIAFMIKWALAAIPAMIILGFIGFVIIAFLAALARQH